MIDSLLRRGCPFYPGKIASIFAARNLDSIIINLHNILASNRESSKDRLKESTKILGYCFSNGFNARKYYFITLVNLDARNRDRPNLSCYTEKNLSPERGGSFQREQRHIPYAADKNNNYFRFAKQTGEKLLEYFTISDEESYPCFSQTGIVTMIRLVYNLAGGI